MAQRENKAGKLVVKTSLPPEQAETLRGQVADAFKQADVVVETVPEDSPNPGGPELAVEIAPSVGGVVRSVAPAPVAKPGPVVIVDPSRGNKERVLDPVTDQQIEYWLKLGWVVKE
jgi:hypothetical protein